MATKLYTGSGDDGTTGLFGPQRVDKDHPQVEAYGAVDEVNALIGMAAVACEATDETGAEILRILKDLQSRLFDLGADLATLPGGKHEQKIKRITARDVSEIEAWIDSIEAGNEPLSDFVLPGGTELAARLHLARTVCRRAERRMVNLGRSGPLNKHALIYVNRLGDLLFAMARRSNRWAGVAEVLWKQHKRRD
ncbi:MAG: cob(I)yrinic acid a,c-diamide adenosyltransferase [Planctomycetes bacterium]|nr:cob(I)yrinic acid a,c-diamide adenosyltransferase [Planctomycetota bacterium]